MNRSLQIIFTLFSLAFCVFLARGIFSGPEARIRQKMGALEGLVSYEAEESNLNALTKARRLGALFTEDVEVEIRMPGLSQHSLTGRKQVQATAMAARSHSSNLNARLVDIEIEVSNDSMSATVEATGHAQVAGERDHAVQDFVFYFISTEEGWLINKVITVDSLR